ncbi:allophanate hydrolase [Pseudooceanicola aestuarii]|uniref:allophanate hydrolase n=1 Tax=Pseudooceanicola aestuarii TaxID=2697319 RepID=UPI0013D25616|nr:allophanate hydrolase [Pseudooceanicola aestuarii]
MTIPLTFDSLARAYDDGVPPSQIIAQVYDRIRDVADPGIFITLRAEAEVQAEVAALGPRDASRPLWGIPFAVKDNIDVAGLPTTAACPAWEYRPSADAFVVARLREAGAIVIGKTNLDQFATGLVGVRTPYGAPKNAVDPEIVPGGSSGGSGVAVAQGIVSFALGTDTAGSGRVPAALNNIVGLKPTLGSWSASGSVPACRSVETISVFALTIADAHAAFRVGAVFDPADSYARRIDAPALPAAPTGLRIGVPDDAILQTFGDTAQAASFHGGLHLLEAQGHRIVPLDFTPFHDVADMLYNGAWVAERHSVIADLLARAPEEILPVTRQIIAKAETLSATDAFRGFYRLKDLTRRVEEVMADLDLLCVPTIPTFYSVADLERDPVGPNSNLGTYTNFVNLLDMCALALPIPARSDGRPGSVTLLAGAGQDARLAAMGQALEQAGARTLGATGWPRG